MKIYVGHSSDIDFKENLYRPLKQSDLSEAHELVFPHEDSDELFDSRSFLRDECDLFVAEVSEASTGLGIELGWADRFEVPVLCVYRKGSDPSGSLRAVTDEVLEYGSKKELVDIVRDKIRELV